MRKYLAYNLKLKIPNDGAGSGGGEGTGTNTSEGDGKNNGEGGKNEGQNGNSSAGTNEGKNGNGGQNSGTTNNEKKFSQEELDKIVQERLAREKAAQERKEKETQGEFQKLYEEMKPKYDGLVSEMDSLKKDIQERNDNTNTSIDAETKDWPEAVKALDPGKENIKARQTWVTQSRTIVEQLKTGSKPPNLEGGAKGKKTAESSDLVSSFMTKRYSQDNPTK